MPKVSVIIPAFNHAAYISEALDSVLSQAFAEIEIIVIDDGSSDNTRKAVEGYLESSGFREMIKYLYQDNQGVSAARNKGISCAQGEYIAFLDADDLWLPQKLSKQISFLESHPNIGYVYSGCYFIDERGERMSDDWRKIKFISGYILPELLFDFFIILSGLIIRRKCIDVIGGFDERFNVGEDYDFCLRLAKDFKAEAIEERLFLRRVVKDSLSRQDLPNSTFSISDFLHSHPELRVKYRRVIKNGSANRYFLFGYSQLIIGNRRAALSYFLKSLRQSFSLKTLKNVFLCFLPHRLYKILKYRVRGTL